jgi:hypothetical protein
VPFFSDAINLKTEIMKKIFTLTILVFFLSTVAAQTVSIVPPNSSWKYRANGSNQGTAWRATSFYDGAWASGNAELGYGDGGEATVVGYGPNASDKYRTTYFRKAFSVANPASYSGFTLSLLRDDGAVVYLNGVEVVRSNMPTGTIDYRTLASTAIGGIDESTYYAFTLSPSSFVAGNNVLAVEIHQSAGNSTDISFNLKLDATSIAACGTPASLSASSITTSSATLAWAAVSSATSYNIRYRVVGTATWTSTTSATTTKSVTALTASTGYEFQVQAVCSAAGAFSSSVNFTTAAAGTTYLIAANSSWKYLDNGTNQGAAWRATAFGDAAWATGNAELGYGDGGEATVVSYGTNAAAKYITTYFRKSFTVANPAAYTTLGLDVVRDDGVVAYLNGTEVYRNNMSTGTIAYNTLAGGGMGDEAAWNTGALSPSALVAGTNVLAVEIHQVAVSSTDISFNARLYAGTGSTPAVVTRGAYLQKLTQSSVTVRWRTDIASNSRVQYGTTLTYGGTASDAALTTEHIVTLTGLAPATKYYYSIGTSTTALQGNTLNNFYTAPNVGSTAPIRIWALGDFGNGSTAQTAVRDAYTTYTGATPTNLWIWLGDDAYETGTDLEFQNKVFAKYPDQFKSVPLFPSPGNHDYAQAGYQSASSLTTNFPYFSIFSMPQNGESGSVASGTPKYYSFNYGNVHFISLDSYGTSNAPGSAMYTWLNNDLAANTQRWTVAYFHHPPYTKGSHNSDTAIELKDMRTNIIPLLESYHVDVVLSGHSHNNERSYLIKGHYGIATTFTSAMKISASNNTFVKTPPYDGTVYVVCGTGGGTSTGTQPGYPMPCMFFSNLSYACSLVIDVSGDNLACKYLASSGAIVDQFTITKNNSAKPVPSDLSENTFDVVLAQNAIMVNYKLAEVADMRIELFDVLGQKIASDQVSAAFQPKGSYTMELPGDYLSEGFYLVRITVNGKSIVKKVYRTE